MTLGALTEIIGDKNYLLNELKKLNVDGYHIEISKKIKNGIAGTYISVILEDEKVKDLSKKIFMRVANAESKVHNKPL